MDAQVRHLAGIQAMAKRQAVNVGRLRLVNPLARAAVDSLPLERREHLLWRLSLPDWYTVDPPIGEPLKLWSDNTESVTNSIVRRGFGTYEPEALPVALALAKQAKTIFDVGAHVGVYSLCMARANPDAQIFAFEPVDVVYKRLVQNVTGNDMTQVTCVGAAVGNADKLVPLFAPAADKVGTVASTVPRHRLNWREVPYQCDFVPQTTLDSFAESAGVEQVDLVKIDVEQAELGVLEGMTGLLATRPHVICEVFPEEWIGAEQAAAVARLVASHDYNVFLLTPDGPLPRRSVQGDKTHWNQLFTTMTHDQLTAALG